MRSVKRHTLTSLKSPFELGTSVRVPTTRKVAKELAMVTVEVWLLSSFTRAHPFNPFLLTQVHCSAKLAPPGTWRE